jgi:hypothetical protein
VKRKLACLISTLLRPLFLYDNGVGQQAGARLARRTLLYVEMLVLGHFAPLWTHGFCAHFPRIARESMVNSNPNSKQRGITDDETYVKVTMIVALPQKPD